MADGFIGLWLNARARGDLARAQQGLAEGRELTEAEKRTLEEGETCQTCVDRMRPTAVVSPKPEG
jgi:hypothetical protein